ncbi:MULTISPECIES: NAD(P)H-binding protein [Oenococcus]|uniref:Oxidoreductase n=1 Tax=Oenococcus kitaharae DSM 17330 TaxID=1045004 RepID=G9WHK2_9LACO|nr:NAD(P)H-binding protein [Oenococcus kitaharae]EHN58341.1 oxidoreductase [Oenococcus kitaharae DSM 17330]OEY81490.1 saccharopine dehydrogenase [Oenococcus kitaharae]OEY82977.1 saccharopine dehydrogenase [Oenococcus kitaharae]OEY84478.1 saccharopine dehydrogenase [Oenococcus kitaharae]
MKVAIIGAAGHIPRFLIPMLEDQTDAELILFARQATQRLLTDSAPRVRLVDGDASKATDVKMAIADADVVFMDFDDPIAIKNVIAVMDQLGKKRLIVAGLLGVYDEVAAAFGKWNQMMIGSGYRPHKQAVTELENSDLDYTYMRMTWLYDQDGNHKYEIQKKGQPLIGAQVARQAVSQYVIDLIKDPKLGIRESNGVVEPNTNFAKPSFY